MINVTKTHLPDINKLNKYIEKMYSTGWITNNGPLVKELERRLQQYLGVGNIVLVTNGTLALQLAYKLLNFKGDILTTPFSFIATTSSLAWEGLNPVFVDIEKDSFNMDWRNIEKRITKDTTGIVPVHVFGNACAVEKIDELAQEHNLKVVYDAAHTFGVKYKGQSLLNYGDISMLSFHATKVFHTIEGGALIINDDSLYQKAKQMINFGLINPVEVGFVGTNAKMNEFQAAMGLCVLDDMEEIMEKRNKTYDYYMSKLLNIKGISFQHRDPACTQNYSYLPILLKDQDSVIRVKAALEQENIYARRYFYPSLDTLSFVQSEKMEVSNDIAEKILCLPLYQDLDEKIVNRILEILLKTI